MRVPSPKRSTREFRPSLPSQPPILHQQLCVPVVDSVEAVYDEVGAAANFIHIEIFKDFETFEYTDEIEEWGLISEPWTFVLDRDGRVAAKFGGPVSPRELGG